MNERVDGWGTTEWEIGMKTENGIANANANGDANEMRMAMNWAGDQLDPITGIFIVVNYVFSTEKLRKKFEGPKNLISNVKLMHACTG